MALLTSSGEFYCGNQEREEGIAENAMRRLVILPTRHHRVIGPIDEEIPKF
jgi:hypothetical protein